MINGHHYTEERLIVFGKRFRLLILSVESGQRRR